MALSGSQKAYLQARSNIARSGATRSNYYFFSVVVTIDNNGTPVDVSAHVAHNGWSISMNINDEIDTATLRLLPSLPFVPKTRSQVKIGFGSASNVQFGGVVMTMQRTRKQGPDPRFWYELTCVDWLSIFDAHLVLAEYPAQSVTTTILDIVARFTQGNFSTVGVARDMPSVDGFQVINERPSTVLRRLTNLIGGGFYIDALRQIRAWSAAVPSPILESAPQPLTDTLATLKQFRIIDDASQQRTRVFVEGIRTSTLMGPSAAVEPIVQNRVPVDDASALHVSGGGVHTGIVNYIRIGAQLVSPYEKFQPNADAANNPPGTVTTADAAVGATGLFVADVSAFPPFGFASVGDQVVPFTRGTGVLILPAAGYVGALRAPVTKGTQVVVLPWLFHEPMIRVYDPIKPKEWWAVGTQIAQPTNTPVVVVSVKQNDLNANSISVREGSDGYYEHLVQDGRYTSAGAASRADAELASFAAPLVAYEWDTDDLNAEPGRIQQIALANGTPVSASVRITNVEVNPITSKDPPRRTVRATSVQPASVVDVWIEDTR